MRWPGNEGSSVVLTLWIWTPRRQPCHSANRSICLETQYGRLGCVLEKMPGEPPLASQLSLVAPSPLFFLTLHGASEEGNGLSRSPQSCDQTSRVLQNNSAFWRCRCLLHDLWLGAEEPIHVFLLFMLYPWMGLAAWQFFFFINTFMKLGLLLGPSGMTELSKMCCFFC